MLCAVLEKTLILPGTWVFVISLFHTPVPFGLPKDVPAELFRPSRVPAQAGHGRAADISRFQLSRTAFAEDILFILHIQNENCRLSLF